jgi:hypothetical protein
MNESGLPLHMFQASRNTQTIKTKDREIFTCKMQPAALKPLQTFSDVYQPTNNSSSNWKSSLRAEHEEAHRAGMFGCQVINGHHPKPNKREIRAHTHVC